MSSGYVNKMSSKDNKQLMNERKNLTVVNVADLKLQKIKKCVQLAWRLKSSRATIFIREFVSSANPDLRSKMLLEACVMNVLMST